MIRQSMFALLAGAAIISAPAVQGQSAVENWPQRAITLFVPAPPGGAADTLSRAVAEGLSAHLGQAVVVENRSGGTGTLSWQATLRAPADGYTYALGYPSVLINSQFMIKDLPFNTQRDLQSVVGIAFTELVMNVNASVPAKNPQELIDWLKKQTGNLAHGSYGEGSYSHIVGSHLNRLHGINAVHVPYKGEQPMMLGMAGNEYPYGITTLSVGKNFQDTGKTRMIGIFTPNRSPLRPELPTFKESGMTDPALQMTAWFGLFSRKDVPQAITQKMEAAVLRVLNTPVVRERLTTLSMPAWGATGKELEATWFSEISIYEKLLRQAGVQMH